MSSKIAAKINKRIVKEHKSFAKNKKKCVEKGDNTLTNIWIEMINNNPRYSKIVMKGPIGTPYENGFYVFNVFMTKDYPLKAPLVKLMNKIYHPNIDSQGNICLNILKDDDSDGWQSAITLEKLAISLCQLLAGPNLDDPLDVNVTNHFKTNPKEATIKATEWAKLYASDNPVDD